MLQPETAAELRSRGGIQAIAVSHPHFYGGIDESHSGSSWNDGTSTLTFVNRRLLLPVTKELQGETGMQVLQPGRMSLMRLCTYTRRTSIL